MFEKTNCSTLACKAHMPLWFAIRLFHNENLKNKKMLDENTFISLSNKVIVVCFFFITISFYLFY